jgi:hypothetical protein
VAKIEDRLHAELERLVTPGDPAGVVDHVLRRAARRHAARRVGAVMLTLGVIAGSIAGVYGLSFIFREASPSEPSAPGVSNGMIVFSRDISGEGEHLFAATPDGSEVRRLTPDGQAVYRAPDVSPDGRTVVVAHEIPSFGFDQAVLATVPIEGGSPTWLSDEPWVVRDLAFSPDGGRLAFEGSPGGPFGIYVFDLETGDVRLVPGTDGISVGHPTWSPDGTRIGFEGSTGGGQDPAPWDIYTVAVDGSGMTNLTNTPDVSEIQPAWSWTLDRITFVEGGPAEGALRTMSSTGADAKTAYSGELAPANPVWAPDGLAIAFEAGSEGIFIVGSDGAPLVVLNLHGTQPAWQPLPEGDEVSPQPSPSPKPSESPASEVAQDIGLGFPVCNVSSIEGHFDTPNDDATAFVATRAGDTGGCLEPRDAFNVIAVDADGDGLAESSYGPIECLLECRTFSAPDVDGDGINEVAVAVDSTGGSTLFELYAVGFGTEPRRLGFECSNCNEGLFAWGGAGGHMEGAYCTPDSATGDFVIWTAERSDVGDRYALVEIVLDVKGQFLTAVDRRDSFVPFDLSALPPGGGDDFCGAPVAMDAAIA